MYIYFSCPQKFHTSFDCEISMVSWMTVSEVMCSRVAGFGHTAVENQPYILSSSPVGYFRK